MCQGNVSFPLKMFIFQCETAKCGQFISRCNITIAKWQLRESKGLYTFSPRYVNGVNEIECNETRAEKCVGITLLNNAISGENDFRNVFVFQCVFVHFEAVWVYIHLAFMTFIGLDLNGVKSLHTLYEWANKQDDTQCKSTQIAYIYIYILSCWILFTWN